MISLHAIRLHPGADLKLSILEFASSEGITAGTVVSCVGALSHLRVRLAGATPDHQPILDRTAAFEIVAITGTVETDDAHLHISASDKAGAVWGGHLKDGCIVDVTAEVVILADDSLRFTRQPDDQTGFDELVIEPNLA